MAMDPQTAQAVRQWKDHRFKPDHLPFTDAVNSLLTYEPKIQLKRSTVRTNEWNVCLVGTDTPAVMTFAGVFSESDPYQTGNLVWEGNAIPPGLDQSRTAKYAGFKAAYSYAIETYHDKEIWDLQRTLDEHVKGVKDFNSGDVPRLSWQNGEMMQLWRFYMRVPMFFPCQGRAGRPRIPEWLHPWVKAAHGRTRSYRANPTRPRVCVLEPDGHIRDVTASGEKKLEYGDVVSLVFTVVYIIGLTSWSPTYMLTHVVRVMPANRDAYPLVDEEDPDAGLDSNRRDTDNIFAQEVDPTNAAHPWDAISPPVKSSSIVTKSSDVATSPPLVSAPTETKSPLKPVSTVVEPPAPSTIPAAVVKEPASESIVPQAPATVTVAAADSVVGGSPCNVTVEVPSVEARPSVAVYSASGDRHGVVHASEKQAAAIDGDHSGDKGKLSSGAGLSNRASCDDPTEQPSNLPIKLTLSAHPSLVHHRDQAEVEDDGATFNVREGLAGPSRLGEPEQGGGLKREGSGSPPLGMICFGRNVRRRLEEEVESPPRSTTVARSRRGTTLKIRGRPAAK